MTTDALPAAPARPSATPVRVTAAGSRTGHVVLSILSVLSLGPVLWMYLASFRPANAMTGSDIFTAGFSLQNYRAAFDQLPILELFWHTVAMATLIAIGQLITSLLAAYAFARWDFRGRSLLFLAFVGTWLVPFQVTMLPNYVLLSHLGLLNSLGGVVIPQLSSAYGVILLRQHFKSFPTELLDAAQMDGRSSWGTLWRVVVPNMAPSLAALGILLFISAWNEYFWPFLVYREPSSSVLQLGVQTFLNAESLNYGALMAASGLACLPILALYLVLQRRVVNAFVRSGLK
jgi:sn-glycerol 3-phosphate transport system permease protein